MEIRALFETKEMTIEMAMDMFNLIEESIEPECQESYNTLAESLEVDFLKTNDEKKEIFANWKKMPNNLILREGYKQLFNGEIEALWAAYLSIGLIIGGSEWFGNGDGRASALQCFYRFGKEFWVKCERDGIIFLLPEEYFMRKLTNEELKKKKDEARDRMIKGSVNDFVSRDVALFCVNPVTDMPLIDKNASTLDRYYSFRNNKIYYDADASIEANVIYEEAFSFMSKLDKKEIRQQDTYNDFGLKFEIASKEGKSGVAFRGDTMNSVATTNRAYIEKFKKKASEGLPQEALTLIDFYHTIGNFMVLPAGFDGKSINGLRGVGPSKDYFDLYLLAIYNAYLEMEGKEPVNAISLDFLLCEDCDLTDLMKNYLRSFMQDGKNGWNNFVRENYFDDFVKEMPYGKFSLPKELWRGHFKAAESGNVFPKTEKQFKDFWINATERIKIRSFRIYRAIQLKDCDSDYFEPVIYNL